MRKKKSVDLNFYSPRNLIDYLFINPGTYLIVNICWPNIDIYMEIGISINASFYFSSTKLY